MVIPFTKREMRCRLAKGSNLRPRNVINTRSDSAEWPRTTWYHIESLCPLPCIYIPIVLWSRPSVDPLTILLIKLLKSYSLVLSFIHALPCVVWPTPAPVSNPRSATSLAPAFAFSSAFDRPVPLLAPWLPIFPLRLFGHYNVATAVVSSPIF